MTVDEPVEQNDIDEILSDFLEKENLRSAEIHIQGGTQAGDGYLAVTNAIDVKDGEKLFKLFVKAAPKDTALRQALLSRAIFLKEILFYTEILPTYDNFLLEKTSEALDLTAKCYSTRVEDSKEALVFENLKAKHFVMFDKKNLFDEAHVLLVLRSYAKLHGVSYALKDQRPALYEDLCGKVAENTLELFKNFDFQNLLISNWETLREHGDGKIGKVALEKLKTVIEDAYDILQETVDCDNSYKIIIHGDCWMNNMMFKYEVDGNTPIEIKLLDFQLTRVTLPVLDLSYFFYCSAGTPENLSKLDYYLEYYHKNLSKLLRKLGSDPEKTYPYKVFKEQWNKFCIVGLMLALVITKIVLSEGDEIPNAAKNLNAGGSHKDTFYITLNDNKIYVDRLIDLLLHFVDNKFI